MSRITNPKWPRKRKCSICNDIFSYGCKQNAKLYCSPICRKKADRKKVALFRLRKEAKDPGSFIKYSRIIEVKRTERRFKGHIQSMLAIVGKKRTKEIIIELLDNQ